MTANGGRERLIGAARTLLAQHPDREPSTRALYEAAGVAAPTLYHHFGDKDGLLEAVVEDAFSAYLVRKSQLPQTGDLVTDFAAGWDMHVEFGVENPLLYTLMYRGERSSRSSAAVMAESRLRTAVERLSDAGLIRKSVDEAVALTTAMAVGCVTLLIRSGEPADSPVANSMRSALLSELTGRSIDSNDAAHAARLLLARLGSASGSFTSAEAGLLRQWLVTLADHFDAGPQPH